MLTGNPYVLNTILKLRIGAKYGLLCRMSRRDSQYDLLEYPALLAAVKQVDDPRLGQLAGRKELRHLPETLARLSLPASHGNRVLETQHVLIFHLLGFYHPMLRSLRTFDLASQNQHIHKVVGRSRVCRSTHSDFLAAVDPATLWPVIQALRKKIPAAPKRQGDEDIETLLEHVVAYDGSYLEVPVTVAWAMQTSYPAGAARKKDSSGTGKSGDRKPRKRIARIRLNLHWAVRRGVPEGVSLDGAKGSESDAFIKALEPDVIYVLDRGIFSFKCLEELSKHHSHYVARLKANIALTTERERPLTAADAAHGVVSDRTGYFPGSRNHKAPALLVREIVLMDPTRPGRPIRLITDLLELPAHIIGLLYQQRWPIELFFRWLKVHNHFAHWVTHSREGAPFVFYIMAMALLLHTLLRGRPPDKYDVLFYQMAFLEGQVDPGMVAGLARLEWEKELARQRYARKKALK